MTWRAALCVVALAAAGCATTGEPDPRDPWEGFNRGVFGFNEGFDQAIATPVASAYKAVLPGMVRTGVSNFFSNLTDLMIGANNLLQGKPEDAINDWARFLFNTTFGLLGVLDVASDWGLEKHAEDVGQTFAVWGMGDGPYVVLPFLGPSTARDGVGLIFDFSLDPLSEFDPDSARNFLWLVRFTNYRANLLDATRLIEEAALDKYVFQRDAYLQRRRSLIYDGNPPRERRETGSVIPQPGTDVVGLSLKEAIPDAESP